MVRPVRRPIPASITARISSSGRNASSTLPDAPAWSGIGRPSSTAWRMSWLLSTFSMHTRWRSMTTLRFTVSPVCRASSHRVARLMRRFQASRPNETWVADITFIPTREGWLYLALLVDVFSRMIVGWVLCDRMTRGLVIEALEMALGRRRPPQALLHHSDQGSQYASHAYQVLLRRHGIRVSMRRKGDCWDNALMESVFGRIKSELVHLTDFATRSKARSELFDYIEVFYNRQRRHSSLGYLSPAAFEASVA